MKKPLVFPQQQQLDVSSLPDLHCQSCGCEAFVAVRLLKTVGPLQSPTGKPAFIERPAGYLCASCGNLNDFNISDEQLAGFGLKRIVFDTGANPFKAKFEPPQQ